jgi:chloride channel 7
LIENDLFRQDWRSRKRVEILQYVAVKWTFVFLVGVLTGLVAFGNNLAVENIAGLKFVHSVNLMNSDRFSIIFLTLQKNPCCFFFLLQFPPELVF